MPRFNPMPESVPDPPEGFIQYVFRVYWEAHRVPERREYSTPSEAIQQLIDGTGYTQDEIAWRLLLSRQQLGAIRTGKKVANQFHYAALREMATEFSMPILADYFRRCEERSQDKVAATKGRKVRTGPMEDGFSEIKLGDW